jgi:hypothetical protein
MTSEKVRFQLLHTLNPFEKLLLTKLVTNSTIFEKNSACSGGDRWSAYWRTGSYLTGGCSEHQSDTLERWDPCPLALVAGLGPSAHSRCESAEPLVQDNELCVKPASSVTQGPVRPLVSF